MTAVTIGGEQVQLADFMAFKAIKAMEIISEVEGAWRDVLDETASFVHDYETKNVVELPRAEARRQMRPAVLYRQEEGEDGRVKAEPVLGDDGQPLLGPDPLGHLTEDDWQASDNVLRMPESPSEAMRTAAMVPVAFKLARTSVLRMLALLLTSNRDLEQWDENGDDIDARLDDAGKRLLHQASAAELVNVTTAAMHTLRDQLSGPFVEAREAFRNAFSTTTTEQEEATQTEPEREPMRLVEDGSSEPAPTSSTDSPADTAGTPAPASTEPAGASSSS